MDGVISFAQIRMCILDALGSRARDSVVPFAWRVRGPLDITALRDAVNAVVDRNVALRTRYTLAEGKPVAIVDREAATHFTIENVENAADGNVLQETIAALTYRPFRLSSDPVMRVFVIKVSDNEIILLIAIHHIAVDGSSIVVLMDELSELYSAYVSGRRPALPDITVGYSEYAAWQQEWARGPEAARQLDYWRQTLANLDELELPADHPRRVRPNADGKSVPFTFDQKLSARILRAARDNRTSVFTFLVAAFSVVLSRYARQEDVAVGVPVEARGRPEFEKIVGLFVNTVVLRTRARPDLTFTEYLRDVREAALGAVENQDVPFDLVVQELRPHRDLSRNPLFEIMFSFDSTGPAVLRLAGLDTEEFPERPETTQFDLGVEIGISPDGVIGGQLIYAVDLFEQSTIAHLSERYERVLQQAVGRQAVRLGEIQLLGIAEQVRMIQQGAGQTVPLPGSLAHELFEQQTAAVPTSVAATQGQDELSYQRLNGDANEVGHRLLDLGIVPDEPVGVFLRRGGRLVTALLAVLKAGGVYLPLDPELSDERISAILADAGAAAVLTDSTLAPRLAASGVLVVTIDATNSTITGGDRTNLVVKISKDNLAYLVYSAGSTGDLEGVAVPHRALLNALAWSAKCHRIQRSDQVLLQSHVMHDGSIREMLAPLIVGASVVIASDDSPSEDRRVDLSAKNASTVVQLIPPPVQYAMYAAAGWQNVGQAGKPTIETPADNVVARVLDSHMNVVPPGLQGILHLGGQGLGRGYRRNPRLTAERLIPDPYGPPGARLYVTEDIVVTDECGAIRFVSRSDRQIRLLGRRVQLDDIESAVAELPLVSQAAVVLDGSKSARRLICYIVAESGTEFNPNVVRRAMREILPSHMIPAIFVAVQDLPSTAAGRVDYERLQEVSGILPLPGVRRHG